MPYIKLYLHPPVLRGYFRGIFSFVVSAENQTDYNYGRALIWTAVMTFMSRLHPQFDSVFSIEAVNEPIMNATQTPGLGDCKRLSIRHWFTLLTPPLVWPVQKNFVRTVRAVEWLIGVDVPGCLDLEGTPHAKNLDKRLVQASAKDSLGLLTLPVIEALKSSFPMLFYIAQELEWMIDFTACQSRQPITTKLVFTSLSRCEKLTGSRF